MRWMDRVRSDLRQHQLDPKLAQNREACRKAVMAIDRDNIGKGEHCPSSRNISWQRSDIIRFKATSFQRPSNALSVTSGVCHDVNQSSTDTISPSVA